MAIRNRQHLHCQKQLLYVYKMLAMMTVEHTPISGSELSRATGRPGARHKLIVAIICKENSRQLATLGNIGKHETFLHTCKW